MARLAYILAASHSGSTLLAMLLGSHPQICTAGELKATSLGNPDQYRCSCRELIRKCTFWTTIKEVMAERGFDFDITTAGTDLHTGGTRYTRRLLRPLHRSAHWERIRDFALSLSPTWRATLPRIQARNLALVQSLLEITGASIVVDSSKIGLRLKYLLKIPQLDVKVIRLVRDGRAVALTYVNPSRFADAKDPTLRGGGTGVARAGHCPDITAGAREWRRSNEEAEHILSGLDRSQWTSVRYEDVCADPKKALAGLSEFLGLAAPEGDLAFRSAEHHVVGNGMRLDTTTEIRLDERWRSALTRDDLKAFDSVAGAMNRRYGYA